MGATVSAQRTSAERKCVWCGEPATTTAPYGLNLKVPACDLDAAWAKRKGRYLPCVISADFDSMTPAEQVAVVKATYWSDLITEAEWPVVLRHDGVKAYVKSRLKRKSVGWLMALSRIVRLHPTFAAQVLREADDLYRKQVREAPPIPWRLLADLLEQGWSQDGLEEWLQPLRNLRSYGPRGLGAVAESFAYDSRFEEWQANDAEPVAA